ncbi:MAG: hypothetical protein FWG41_01810 [Methanomassiliicoccaceae archaeon]|nr:hypothetical protein [Methanomassiliicoccaceae archaeon]
MTDYKSTSSIYSILVLLGGLIGVIAVFIAWISMDLGLWGTFEVTGWEIIRESLDNPSLGSLSDDYVQWMPLLVLIFSAIGLITGLIGVLKPRKEFGAGAVVCGLLTIVAAVVFYLYDFIKDFAGMGIYLAIVAGVMMLIFGALRLSTK